MESVGEDRNQHDGTWNSLYSNVCASMEPVGEDRNQIFYEISYNATIRKPQWSRSVKTGISPRLVPAALRRHRQASMEPVGEDRNQRWTAVRPTKPCASRLNGAGR